MSKPQVSSDIQSFIDSFYKASDVGPVGHQDYIEHYDPECVLIMGPVEYKGHSGIAQFRESGWEKVETRKHTYSTAYVSTEKPESEVMLYGTVDYKFKDGSTKEGVEWAARMVLKEDKENKPKLFFYQVYLTQR